MKTKHLPIRGGITPRLLTTLFLVLSSAALLPHATFALTCTPAPDGLVSWWQAEGDPSDSIGGNDGTIVGNLTYAAGEVGQAFSLDGNHSGLTLGNPVNLQLQDFTIDAWVKRGSVTQASLDTGGGVLFGYGLSGYQFGISDNGKLFLANVGNTAVTSTVQVTDLAWHHVAVTKSGSTVVFYLDGVANPAPTFNTTFQFFTTANIGALLSGGLKNSFLGLIDELDVFDHALSASEVQGIYNAGIFGKCTGNIPPTIVTQPTNQSTVAGNVASFSVTVTGSQPLTYQWLLNGTNVVGPSSPTLTLSDVQPINAGNYSVFVSSPFGATNSSNALLTVTAAPICTPPSSGLVSWWPGNGNTLDAIGGNNGTLVDNATFTTGEVGQAFTFDGHGDGVLVGNPANLQLQTFTIEAWVKRGSVTQASLDFNGGIIFGYGHSGYGLALSDDGHALLSEIEDSAVFSTRQITDLNWHHLAVTRASSNVVFYVDGVADPAPAYNPTFLFNTPAAVGSRGDTFANTFLGSVDELSIYNRVLAASEIQAIYNAGGAGKCSVGVPPAITSQPTNQTVLPGTNVTFSVGVTGTAPLGYQWRLNGGNTGGETNSTLSLSNVQVGLSGNLYSVTVSNAFGTTNSTSALLTVFSNSNSNCTPPPSGLVSWWPGNGNTLDVAGTNNGTLVGNAAFAAGEVGQAFTFDGHGDGVLVGNPTNLQLQTFTIEAWVKRGSVTQASLDFNGGIIFGYGDNGYGLALSDDGHALLSQIDDNAVFSTRQITDLNWHHLAVTRISSNVVFYVDGVADPASAYNPTFLFTTPAAVGTRGDTFANTFLGSIDEVSIYNQVLTASQIQAIFNAGSAGKCSTGVAPTITSQPTNQTVLAGANVTFNVNATGTAPLGYQWQVNNGNIGGETNSSLSLVNVQPGQSGNMYSVIVSNAFGTTNSTSALLTVTSVSVCTPPPSGLVSWWQAESNANDTVGGNNGALLNGASFAAGEVGQAFSLNGGGHVRIPDAPNLRFTTAMTVEAWVNPANTANNQQIVSKWDAVGGIDQRSYGLAIYSDGRAYIGVTSDGSASGNVTLFGTNTVPANQWTHIAGTYDGATLKIYLNGVLDSSMSYSAGIFPGTDDMGIGGAVGGEPVGGVIQPFAGLIDEVSVYNRALTPSEIQAIFAAGSAGKCNDVPPMITGQPANQTVPTGATVTFSINASGTAPLDYQWQVNNSNIGGQTNRSLSLTNVQSGQSGNLYSVIVSNAFGTTNSTSALLTVTATGTCTPPASGLVSWWPGNGNTLDVAGTNNGTLVGNAAFGTGEVGQAFTFDGHGDGVLVGNPAGLQLQNFTIEGWVKRGSVTQASLDFNGGIIFGYGDNGYALALSDDGHALLGSVGVSSVFSTHQITDMNWHHLAATKSGTNIVFYMDGVADPAPAFGLTFVFNTPAAVGSRGDTFANTFLGSIDELSIYNQMLTASQIQAIFSAGSAGKCNEVQPTITSQPASQMVPAGANVTFSVGASGTAPLGYQWKLNNSDIGGQTNSSLSLTNVQPGQSGNMYSVVVSNAFGSATSSNALLTVTTAVSALQVVSVNAGGGVAVVPINLIANGRENAMGFSINFDPSLLSFTGVTLGSGDASGILLSNTALITSGKLGLGVALPANTTFAAGTQQVVKISFTTKPVTNLTVTPISFGDQPTVRQVSDAHAVAMQATYAGGTVTIPFSFEGDVTPRPTGDGVVSITDWVEVGRFAAHLDIPMTPAEFQRADCAPRSTLGNGLLTVADWVQAGRYAIGLDPLTPAGGPTGPGSPSPATVNQPGLDAADNRTVTVTSADTQAGQACDVSIQLSSQGNENALGFNLTFDPSVLSFTGASLGSGATGAALNVNDQQAASGTIGLALALPIGSTFAAQTQELVRLHFVVASSAAGNTAIIFGGQPVTPEVVDAIANPVTTAYVNGKLAIVSQNGSPLLTFSQTDAGLALSWPASASGFSLESSDSLTSPNWSGVGLTPITNATDITVTIPLSNSPAFYRLRHP